MSSIRSASLFLGNGPTDKVGTVRWMSPELLDENRDPVRTFQSDVYALGMVFWEVRLRQHYMVITFDSTLR